MIQIGSAMVLNGESKVGLDVVRCLGRQGVPVIVGSYDRHARCFVSRYCKGRFTYSHERNDEIRHHAIFSAIQRFRPRVLMPIYDDTYRLVLERAEEYQPLVRLIAPDDFRLFEFCNDKEVITRFAQRHGVPVPKTFYPKNLVELKELKTQLPYPILAKPRAEAGGRGIVRLEEPKSFDEYSCDLERKKTEAYPILQEFIPGEDLEVTLIVDRERLLAATVDRVLQNHPLPYGPPVACETIHDDETVQIYFRLLCALSYRGIAHIDLRRDARDGKPKMLDFNPRLGGSTGVSISAGIPLPYLLYLQATGQDVIPSSTYRLVKHRWIMFEQLRHFVDSPDKGPLLRELLDLRRTTTEIDFTDPLPHLRVVAEVLKGIPQKILGRMDGPLSEKVRS